MKNPLIYDIPTRLFHWLFLSLFLFSFLVAEQIDSDSPVFLYHMLAGVLLSFVVLMRIIWGFVGSRYALFNSFAFHPKDLVLYFTGVLKGDKRKWTGHNPASSWAGLLMMALALGLGATGYLMTSGQKEIFEDAHELLADGFLIVALLHVAGLLFHFLRHRDHILLAMVDGTKSGVSPKDSISQSHGGVALIFIALVVGFSIYLFANFDSENQTLRFFNTLLELGD